MLISLTTMMNINRPFPRRCPMCGKIDVYATTIRYKTARKVLGVLYEFETPDVIVNQCQTCKEYLIPQKTHPTYSRQNADLCAI